MTISELERQYKIDIEKLRYFADNRLIDENGSFDRKDERNLGVLCTLYDMGLRADALKQFMSFDADKNSAEKVRLLNTYRSNILEDIHTKQKLIDQVDYMIYEINHKKGDERK